MSAEAFTSSVTRSTSPRLYLPGLACSTGVIVFLIW
jgi:hypothetical protein